VARITSKDVAKRAGVSQSVVSAILNGTQGIRIGEEKRKLVLQVIEEMGYHADAQARGLRLGRTHCIAAVGKLKSPIFFQVLDGVQDACLESGYHLLLYGTPNSEESRHHIVDLYSQRRIDGIMTQDTTSYSDPQWAELVREKQIPYVSLEGYPVSDAVSSVLMDYPRSIEMALDYMWSKTGLAPRYIEIFDGPEYHPNWGDRQRLATYKQWMERRGLQPSVTAKPHGQWEKESGWWTEWLARELAGTTGPAAFLSNWSRGAVNLYRAAFELKLAVGRDLFVMAADNTERANEFMLPVLTSVAVPYERMGYEAAKRLIEYIEENRDLTDTSKIWLPPSMIEGGSV
jgi:LacI family transcriptional regulator